MLEKARDQQPNQTWEALKVIGQNLPGLFKNYNHLLSLPSLSIEQTKTFEAFVFNLLFVIRSLRQSNMLVASHPWQQCLKVLEAFEAAIKNGKPIESAEADALNITFQEALVEWDAEQN